MRIECWYYNAKWIKINNLSIEFQSIHSCPFWPPCSRIPMNLINAKRSSFMSNFLISSQKHSACKNALRSFSNYFTWIYVMKSAIIKVLEFRAISYMSYPIFKHKKIEDDLEKTTDSGHGGSSIGSHSPPNPLETLNLRPQVQNLPNSGPPPRHLLPPRLKPSPLVKMHPPGVILDFKGKTNNMDFFHHVGWWIWEHF